ncbi:hypothetical protein D3C85_1104910 [compost metagenome]
MNDQWVGDPVRFADMLVRVAGVVRHRCVGSRTRGREEGQQAAQAVTDHADLARDLRHRTGGLYGGGDVAHTRIEVEGVVQDLGLRELRLRAVGEVEARGDPPEQVGADGQVTLGREFITGLAHVGVDAKDFVDDDDGRRGEFLRTGDVRVEAAPRGGDPNGRVHGFLLRRAGRR